MGALLMVACSTAPQPTARLVPANVDCGAIEQEICVDVLEAAREGLAFLNERRDVASIAMEAVPRRGECITNPDCERRFAVVDVMFVGGGSAALNVYRTEISGRTYVNFN